MCECVRVFTKVRVGDDWVTKNVEYCDNTECRRGGGRCSI